MELPVARVAVDIPLAHLDRPFDYAVPPELDQQVSVGSRIRVRFAGRLVGGYVLDRVATSDVEQLAPIQRSVSAEPVLNAEIAGLARAVADRYAGTLNDVLRLAIPPRHARVEAQEAAVDALPPPRPDAGSWARYDSGPSFLDAVAAGGAPRGVWRALPGPDWPAEIATAVTTALSAGRGAVVVVPDHRDLVRVDAALTALAGPGQHVALAADLGPAERYRRWLAVRRGVVRAAIGTRAAAFAPVTDLGLVVCWDDGDDLHKEPRSPYPHVRDVLALRAHRAGAAALLGGFAPSVDAEALVSSGWARRLGAPRATVRTVAPRVVVAGEDIERDQLAAAARLPTVAWSAARAALADDRPVLVQVPRAGYQPALACDGCRNAARCRACQGPLGRASADAGVPPACRWCGRPAADWSCPECGRRQLRVSVVGVRRTAEELGRAFPGVPVRTSGGEHVLATVESGRALVVATPGAEPVADGGYGAVLLLDGWALLSRPDLRSAEETLRRWCGAAALARPAGEGGQVVVMADQSLAVVQALVRWDPTGFARREAGERAALGFPPVVRMAAVDGPAGAVADLLAAAAPLPAGAGVLGPVAYRDGERALVRAPRAAGAELAHRLAAGLAARSARKAAEPVRVELDPITGL